MFSQPPYAFGISPTFRARCPGSPPRPGTFRRRRMRKVRRQATVATARSGSPGG